jgi:hypothetical protein
MGFSRKPGLEAASGLRRPCRSEEHDRNAAGCEENEGNGLDDGGLGKTMGNLPWFGADDFWDILLLDKLSQIQEM